MRLFEKIEDKEERKKQYLALFLSLVFVILIIFVRIFLYEPPNKKTKTREGSRVDFGIFRSIFSQTAQDANDFVDPVDDYFRQQNPDNSSEN